MKQDTNQLEKRPVITDKSVITRVATATPKTGNYPVSASNKLPDVSHPSLSQPESRFRHWVAGGLLSAILGLALYSSPWAINATDVTVETMATAPATRLLAISGRIVASQSVDLRPLVSGTLAEVFIVEGDVIATGDLLARIDLSAQHAVVRQAVAELDASLVAQDEAQLNLSRNQQLGAAAARSELENAELAMQSATKEVAQKSALLDQAQIQYAHFSIHSPMGGTVLELTVDPGQSVDPSTRLMSIANMSDLEVETSVDEAYATQIALGQRAVLQLAGESKTHDGSVSFVSQRVDAATGGLAVNLAFDLPVTAPIALTVTANIIIDNRVSALTVPRAAIVSDALGSAVYVVSEGIAQRHDIGVLDWPAARLIVTRGLDQGDVVIADATGIVDGQSVSAVKP